MKLQSTIAFLGAALLALPLTSPAQPSAHYVPGVEGIKGASLPPPGIYLRDYNVGYYSDQLNDSSGNSTGPSNMRAYIYANVPRVIWITDWQVLGGNIGVDALVPLEYTASDCLEPRNPSRLPSATTGPSALATPSLKAPGPDTGSSLTSPRAMALGHPRALPRRRANPRGPVWAIGRTCSPPAQPITPMPPRSGPFPP